MRAIKRKNVVNSKDLRVILEKQEFRCALTGVELTPDSSHLDHKTPVSRGGDDSVNNIQWLESNVNRAKGTMTNEEFIAMCKRVVAWTS